jgi:HEAT repeat protein
MSASQHACHCFRLLALSATLILAERVWSADALPGAGALWSQAAAYRLGQDPQPLQALEAKIRATQAPEQRRDLEKQLVTLLNASATTDAKHWACRQLWFLGTDESVPALGRLLAEASCAEMACYALGSNPSPTATEALIRGISTSQGAGRIAILNALAGRAGPAVGSTLETLAASSENSVAEAAIRGLGLAGSAQAAAALKRIGGGASPARLAVVYDAQLRCARLLAAAGKGPAAAAIYSELLQPGLPPHLRRGALLGLVSANPSAALKAAASWLQSAEPALRSAAVAAFRTTSPRLATRHLVPLLQSRSTEAVLQAIHILSDLREVAAVPGLLRSMRHADAEVRIAATVAAGRMANDNVLDALLRLATAASVAGPERDAALAGLRSAPGPRVDPLLVARLASAPLQARPGLIAVIADRGDSSALPALLREAGSGDTTVRRSALRAIARLGDVSQAQALLKLLASLTDNSLRDDCEQAIIDVCRRAPALERSAAPVLASLHPEAPPAARSSMIRILGGLGGRGSLERLAEALKDPDDGVKDTAFRELANWPTPDALPVVRTLFKQAAQATPRTLALRGYARLLAIDTDRPAAERLVDYQQLMLNTASADERKLVLAGVSELADPGALDLALPFLAEPAIRAEACSSLTRIALAIVGAHPEPARRALEQVADAPVDASTKEQAQKVLAQLDAQSSWLTSWQLSGAYSQDGKNHAALFDIAFPPEVPGAQDVRWRDLAAGSDPSRPFVLDVLKALGGEQRVAYVRTFLHSTRPEEAVLELGSDDGAKVWLNGALVHANNIARPLVPDSDKVAVTLREGGNVLLIKLTQNNLGWEFTARLHRPDGRRVEGLRQNRTP